MTARIAAAGAGPGAPDSARPLALVTGATSGIGREVAAILALNGWRVLATGRSAPEEADAALEADEAGRVDDFGEATGAGTPGRGVSGPIWLRVDQSDPSDAAARIGAAVARLAPGGEGGGGADAAGPLSLAVLCAGTGTLGRPEGEGAEAIRRTLRVNLEASVLIAHAIAPRLLAAGGTLALIGSVARGGAGALPSYSASKAGLHGFARALGEEWRGRAGVLALHPGPTRTGMQARAGMDVSRTERFFVPAPLMARMVLAHVGAARDRRAPAVATLGHGAAARRWLAERTGLARPCPAPLSLRAAPSSPGAAP